MVERRQEAQQINSVPVGEGLLGRVVDALGQPVDGKGQLKKKTGRCRAESCIIARKSVRAAANRVEVHRYDDPIGKGQRELVWRPANR